MKAKQVFSSGVLDTLPDPKDKKLMEKIKLLGAANLLPEEREKVCLSDIWRLGNHVCDTAKLFCIF